MDYRAVARIWNWVAALSFAVVVVAMFASATTIMVLAAIACVIALAQP